MTYTEARKAAAEHIGEGRLSTWGITPVILDDMTREIEIGWIFFYESKEYLDTGDFSSRLAGNAPIVVAKSDGYIYETGTSAPVDEFLTEIVEREQRRIAKS